MGQRLFDQYTLLHFAVGVVAYFWGMGWMTFFIIHSIFEFAENTEFGVEFINKYFTIWPGGKTEPDWFINIVGDTIGGMAGWIVAYQLDRYGIANNWYSPKK